MPCFEYVVARRAVRSPDGPPSAATWRRSPGAGRVAVLARRHVDAQPGAVKLRGPPPFKRGTCRIEPWEDGVRVTYDLVRLRGWRSRTWSGPASSTGTTTRSRAWTRTSPTRTAPRRPHLRRRPEGGRRRRPDRAVEHLAGRPDHHHRRADQERPGAGRSPTTTVYEQAVARPCLSPRTGPEGGSSGSVPLSRRNVSSSTS